MAAGPRLALIGPVTPFRGGIAQYTTELHRALAARSALVTVSFRRQYPAWLYPGSSDVEPDAGGRREPGVAYVLDALNPRTLATAERQVARAGIAMAFIDWWTLFWAPGFAWLARRLRARGIPTTFICHNLFDHDSGRVRRGLTRALLAQGSGYLVHSREQAEILRRELPGRPVLVHPHPTYDRFPPPARALPRRGRLELLFFGFIRPYKGLETLIEALALLDDHDVHLCVVGEPWCDPDALRSRIAAAGAPNVELHLEYVGDAQAADFFARADLVVLPYRAATGSGVAAVAYHYERPVLATRVGGLRDVVEHGRTGFLVEPGAAGQIAAILRTVSRADLERLRPGVREFKQRFTWASLADALVEFAARRPLDDGGTDAGESR